MPTASSKLRVSRMDFAARLFVLGFFKVTHHQPPFVNPDLRSAGCVDDCFVPSR